MRGKTNLPIKATSKLRHLNLGGLLWSNLTDIKDIIASCSRYLEKLNMSHYVNLVYHSLDMKRFKWIIENCTNLKEIKFLHLNDDALNYLASNLPLGMEKLHLQNSRISEEILITVVTRCRNLKSLSLLFSKHKNDASVTALTRYLKHSLEELEIFASNDSDMTFEKLLDLRSLQKLRIFNCYDLRLIREEITTLERTLPHLIRPINEKMIYKLGVVNPEEGISEIHAKKLKIFAEN